MQPDLFSYPNVTGSKGGKGSLLAAQAIDKRPSKKAMVHKTILDLARNHSVWPELVAEYLCKGDDDYYKWLLFCRPRFSELIARGLLIETNEYARTAAGKQAAKYKLTIKE